MKRRTFIQNASATALGLLAHAGAQDKKVPTVQPKGQPNINVHTPTLGQTPAQQIISRMQQVAEGGS